MHTECDNFDLSFINVANTPTSLGLSVSNVLYGTESTIAMGFFKSWLPISGSESGGHVKELPRREVGRV